jgi:hypothetical protein
MLNQFHSSYKLTELLLEETNIFVGYVQNMKFVWLGYVFHFSCRDFQLAVGLMACRILIETHYKEFTYWTYINVFEMNRVCV